MLLQLGPVTRPEGCRARVGVWEVERQPISAEDRYAQFPKRIDVVPAAGPLSSGPDQLACFPELPISFAYHKERRLKS